MSVCEMETHTCRSIVTSALLLSRFLRFCLVGALCTGLNLLILSLFTGWIGWHYSVSVVVSFLSVTFVGLVINNRFTFNRKSWPGIDEVKRYYFVTSGSLFSSLVMMYVLVDVAGVNYLLSSIVITLVFTAFNFLAHWVWTFSLWSKT